MIDKGCNPLTKSSKRVNCLQARVKRLSSPTPTLPGMVIDMRADDVSLKQKHDKLLEPILESRVREAL